MRRKEPLLDCDADQLFQLVIPAEFLRRLREGTTGDFVLWIEEGDEESVLTMSELNRPLLERVAIFGRPANDPTATPVPWQHIQDLEPEGKTRLWWLRKILPGWGRAPVTAPRPLPSLEAS